MERGYLLAIDVGTTTTRCLLFDLDGVPVGEAYREPKVYHPRTNWTEVAPEDWWDAVVAVIREVLEQAEVSRERILGIGLCGLEHALVPLDRQGTPLARSMLWMDQRCQPQVAWMLREHGELLEEVKGKGASVSTTVSAPKLRWIVENEPDLLRRTCMFLLVKGFIRFRLTGEMGTDPSDAGGTALLDPDTEDWSAPLLDMVGVPLEKMPPIFASDRVAGGVTDGAARVTGLAPGTPVVVGGGDVVCTRIGANASGPRRACLYLGTAAWISAPPAPSRRRSFGATSTTGASLKWLAGLFGKEALNHVDVYRRLLQEAEGVPPGACGLIFLPHLMGERGPRYDPQAKGVLFGLTLAHGRREIARAVLEGCAFQLRWIIEDRGFDDLEELVVVGGGGKSALWLNIIADVTGMVLRIPRVLEAGALGAAIFAGVGVGIYRSAEEAAERLVRMTGRHEPDKGRHDLYGGIYGIFRELEERVTPLYGERREESGVRSQESGVSG